MSYCVATVLVAVVAGTAAVAVTVAVAVVAAGAGGTGNGMMVTPSPIVAKNWLHIIRYMINRNSRRSARNDCGMGVPLVAGFLLADEDARGKIWG